MSAIDVTGQGEELRGRVLILSAGVIWSLGSLFIRLIDQATVWQIVGWRGMFLAIFLLGYIAWKRRDNNSGLTGAFREAGITGIFGGLALSGAFISFVFAISFTSAAQALLMLAMAPFLAALLGRVILKENPRRATWVCMSIAAIGVLYMVRDGVMEGTYLGALFGFLSAVSFAIYTVILRWGRARDMTPSVCMGGIITAITGFTVLALNGDSFQIPARDIMLCAAMGFIHLGLGLIVFTMGSKYVPAAELPLLTLTEVVFGPIWVWIAVNEVPSDSTLIGGAVLLAALIGNALSGIRRKHPPMGVV